MAEYGIPWDYIDRHWTFSQTCLFVERLNERRKRESASKDGGRGKRRFVDAIKGD